MSDKIIAWVSSVIAALSVGVVVSYFDGPSWAAYGFGFLAFLIWRLSDFQRGRT